MTPGRNDPCSCASGKKYKKCCGAVIPVVPAPVAAAVPREAPAATAAQLLPQRECGPCNACCNGWLAAKVLDFRIGPGLPCKHVCEAGCGIYLERPVDPCRAFQCGWLLAPGLFPESFRPDQLGLIFVPIEWHGRRAWILTPMDREPEEWLLDQMRQHTQRTGEPHMIKKRNGALLCYGSPEFQQDMVLREQRGENPW